MRTFLFALVLMSLATHITQAQEARLFAEKNVTMIVPAPPGGGTDAVARLIGAALSKYLVGHPNIIVQNMPGANGITAMNHFVQRVAEKGLTVMVGSSSQADPATYRAAQSRFNPTTLLYIGGAGRGGTVLVINSEAEGRLFDRSKPAVVMGSAGSVPRSGMLSVAWGIDFLGWNARWVMGYPGTNDIAIALERGEVDLTSTGVLSQVDKLLGTGKFKILTQSGEFKDGRFVARADFGNTPVFSDLIAGKIQDPAAQIAFEYWTAMTTIDKWLALPPGAPSEYLNSYRKAFAEAVRDPDLKAKAQVTGDDFEPMTHTEVEQIMNSLDRTTPEAISYISEMVKRQTKG